MSDLFYVFESGSGTSCWSRYVVPVDAYRISRDTAGNVSLSPVMYGASVDFRSINKKTFSVITAKERRETILEDIIHGKGETT